MNRYDQNYSEFLLSLDKTKNKEIYAKIIALTFNESPIETIEGRITGGTINVDGSSAIRRTCSLTLVAKDFDYSNYIWGLNTKFKLEIGVKNNINPNYDDIIWFKQGIFVLTSFNISRSATNFTINLSGKDKMCLLNGENGGTLESSIDFGTIQEEDENGNWVITKIPIPEIIRNAVHVYGKEPYHNIIINDLDILGKELLEYRYDVAMYLYRSGDPNALPIYDNVLLENDTSKIFYILKENGIYEGPKSLTELPATHLESLVTTLTNQSDAELVYTKSEIGEYKPWYITKINSGDVAGYRMSDLVYAGDLIAKVGESLTSVLDKIKNMLVEYEYFYNLDGQFVFQKKQSFISTMWSSDQTKDIEELPPALKIASTIDYVFSGTELITAFTTNPNISNLKNDFSIWGERESVSGAKIPIHLRYAIAQKPKKYTTIPVDYGEYIINDKEEEIFVPGIDYEVINEYNIKHGTTLKGQESQTYTTDMVDWREIIFQMALDYYKYNILDDFELRVAETNPNEYPSGRTGYETYYSDLEGFWRELYYPTIGTELNEIIEEFNSVEENLLTLQTELYGKDVAWSENKLGGIENDVNALNNLISQEELTKATNLIHFWNTKEIKDSSITYPDNFVAPKYNLVDDEENLITDPILYLGMLQDLYFRKQSDFNSLTYIYDTLKQKKEKLEKDVKENYYTQDSDGIRKYWNVNVYTNSSVLNFWFDFLDSNGVLSQYDISNLGTRPKAVQDSNVKSIYLRETPQIIFKDIGEEFEWASGYRVIQFPSIDNAFTISAQKKSAKEKLDELLYQHTCITETATITTIPIYYLQPNCRVKVFDEDTKLNGDYIINKITIPLTYNGTMSLQITKAIEDIN